MIKLIVIADDITGALDAGVQFSKAGTPTFVSTNAQVAFNKMNSEFEVLVLDLETRHLSPAMAKAKVSEIAALAQKAGIPYLYKKTDSVMRGNIGSELDGLFLDEDHGPLAFVPAYPETGRTTHRGIQYISGIPITQSVFGKDPFSPVLDDYVPDIIARQTSRETKVVTQEELINFTAESEKGKILIFNATSKEEMRSTAAAITRMGPPKLLAGCAGFAGYLPEMLNLRQVKQETHQLDTGLLIICGSINAMTLEQVRYASRHGFTVIELTPEQKLNSSLAETDEGQALLRQLRQQYSINQRLIIQAASDDGNVERTNRLAADMGLDLNQSREYIAANIGKLVGALMPNIQVNNLAVFGGDTLLSVIRAIGEDGIYPICEVEDGIVHSALMFKGSRMSLITKSGGFGKHNCVLQIEEYIQKHSKINAERGDKIHG